MTGKGDVAKFLAANPNPDDDQFHSWAEGEGKDVHKAEADAYELGTTAAKFETAAPTKRM